VIIYCVSGNFVIDKGIQLEFVVLRISLLVNYCLLIEGEKSDCAAVVTSWVHSLVGALITEFCRMARLDLEFVGCG
jgi:hypothetical protein